MSSLKNTNSSSMKSQQPTNQQQTKPSSSYDVFAHVDAMVAKPVYGSDGASRWQAFQSTSSSSSSSTGAHNNKSTSSSSSFKSAAPKAPLKKLDRAVGFTSWQQERQHEESIRATSDAAPLNAGYIHFHKKQEQQSDNDDRKRIQAIKDRKRPDNKQYYLPADTFEGWKFDYVFTTRDEWGTGYFWDGMDSLKELSASPDSKKRSTTTTEGDDDEKISTNNNTNKKQKKHKQQAAPAAVVIRDDPTHPLEQVMAAIQRRTQQQQQPLHSSSASSSTANGIDTMGHGWESATDPASGKTYYYHRVTGERSWEKPLLSDDHSNNDKNPTITALPSGWKSAMDANSGNEYYYHEETGQTRWERPTA